MSGFPFVDAHIHFWDLSRLRYPWLNGPFEDDGPNGSTEAIAHDYGVDAYLADLSGYEVAGAVHVDAGADPVQALDETVWLDQLARDGGLPTGIVAFAALDQPDVEALLAAHAGHKRLRGIRHILNWHPDSRRTYMSRNLVEDDAWWRGFALLRRFDLSFDLQCYPAQMVDIASKLRRHPDTPVIVNHLGMPVLTDPEWLTVWRQGLRALAEQPQVSLKLSGLGFISRNWRYELVAPLLRQALELFGPGRCMVASDAPTDKLFAPISMCLGALARFAADLSESEQRDLWGRNANRIYRLGLPI